MKQIAFSRYHPAVSFVFFVCAIGFGVVIQHPFYLLAGCVSAALCAVLLQGKKAVQMLLGLLPLAAMLAAINPLFNTRGHHILFTVIGRPYTLEALLFGMVISGMLVVMLLWFSCYNQVITSDKFVSLFGNLIPALSLLLVMVLRMMPNLSRKAKQIIGARSAIGKGASSADTRREKIDHGMTVLSALTDWALEGSVITGDSMRARGYGTGKHVSFQLYRFTGRDGVMLAIILMLSLFVILSGGTGAAFTPVLSIPPLTWGYAAYWALLLIPSALQIKEAITWRILRSKI